VVHFFGPYLYRSAFYAQSLEQECERSLAHLDEVFRLEGPQTVAAVLLETVVGTNGILVPPDGYLDGVRALCDQYGAMLICDEVMSGFGRCGEWFAIDRWQVVPDIITFAKGVNSGYVPLGGVLLGPRVYETFAERAYPGGLTYSGHPLACAAAVASIDVMRGDGFLQRVRELGDAVVRPRLEKMHDQHPSIGDVRGLGLFWAIELVRDRATREMLVPYNASGEAAKPMTELAAACKARGLWPFTHFNRVHVVPPCVISADELNVGLDILDDALVVADRYYTGR
jgi:taurine--2-oxoglutarate transaminase